MKLAFFFPQGSFRYNTLRNCSPFSLHIILVHDIPFSKAYLRRKGVVMVLEDLFRSAVELAQFRTPPLGHLMDEFCDWLRSEGFSGHGMRRRLWHALHFNQYLRRRGAKDCQSIEAGFAERFITEHLPLCRCKLRYAGRHVGKPSSARSFIGYLSKRGLIAPSSQPSTPQQQLLQEYLEYLRCERNLAEKTIEQHQL